MEPNLLTGGQAALNAMAATQTGATNATGAADDMMQQMIDQGSQQIFGMLLNLVMSQTSEG